MPLISFDVFDTLLTRTCAGPADVFARIGARLREGNLVRDGDAAFGAARRAAEATAWHRTNPPREPDLAAIYATLATRFGWDEAQRAAALAMEVAVETEGIRPVPGMRDEVARARAAAGRVVFVTDTYLPGPLIRDWLATAGFWHEGDRLFVSNETGESKGAGGLFAFIARELAVAPAEWTHHGDNPVSDVAHATKAGVRAVPREAGRLTARETRLRGAAPATWRSLLAGAARLARLDQPAAPRDEIHDVLWAAGTGVAGPLFHGFVDWCLEESVRRQINDLHFLARGGQVFLRVAEAIQRVRPRPVRLHYLPASRVAFAGADPENDAQLHALAAPHAFFHSAAQAIRYLGLDERETDRPGWLAAGEWHRNLAPAERERLADWLLMPPRRQRVRAALEARAARSRAFLATRGLTPGRPAAIVDTGWHGTIQRNLETLLGSTTPLIGFYLGLAGRPLPPAAGRLGYLNAFQPRGHDGSWYTLVELMARADHGLVLGFDGLQPQLAPLPPPDRDGALFFQDAVVSFCRHALDAGPELAAAPAADLARVVLDQFSALHREPSAAEARVLGRLPHSDQLVEQQSSVLCPPMKPFEAFRAMLVRRRRPAQWWIGGQAQLTAQPLLTVYQRYRDFRTRH